MRCRRMPWLPVLAACLLVGLILGGCLATGAERRLITTPAPGARLVPRTVAVHPLLSTVPAAPGSRIVAPLTAERRSGEVVLQPPARSELLVTGPSQMLTDLFEAELSYAGFRLKALPVQPEPIAEGQPEAFGIGLDLLARLRREFGLQAVVVGNAHFTTDPATPGSQHVAAAFLRVIDIASLDVLAHVALEPGPGLEMSDVAAVLAGEMARLAGAVPDAAATGETAPPAPAESGVS